MALAVEDICNIALRRIGYPTPIGMMYEGSPASRVAVDAYAEIRDDLLRKRDWEFARQTVSLGNPIKTAPAPGYGIGPWTSAYPPPPWIYEYAYPQNCLEVKCLLPPPIFLPEQMPRWVLFEKANDTVLNAPVILTNLANAFAMITGAVYDPGEWTDPGFVEALIDALAKTFIRAFPTKEGVNANILTDRAAEQAAATANERQG